ncbi:60S ribosomal protein L19 [Emericellopsis atlantica]|uniref:60S ribosomal protein L19 n=1 Tax=Emericellopsis atlantica TaxID=2614577 RepID=A0A9P7ZHX6_9HYPO|nr:60S ribosomal protein L19 [Emericellopsis atlantica]KAG9252002.1 60S ribosomal protein L19 [Emericellopsis atlantica]
MSPDESSQSGPWGLRRPNNNKRGKTRNGTFIIPATGERSRRQFTLRTTSSISAGDGASDTLSTAETVGGKIKSVAKRAKDKTIGLWYWFQSDEGHAVLKCTFAYLLGSGGTFFPPLSNFLGHRDGKHVSATITVYFHPARSVGSMIEAVFIGIIAILYAELIGFISMEVVIWGKEAFDIVQPAHVMVLLLCVGGGLGFVGWVKQRLNQPLVNVGSSLTSIAIITIITKEEAIQGGYVSGEKPLQILKLLLLGVASTVVVNLLVWRVSARRVLRQCMIKAAAAQADRLSFITRGFLNGTEEEMDSPEYAKMSANYNKAYTQMTKMLREAKNEHYFVGTEKLYKLDRSLAKCIETVAQSIGGLRSALAAQFMLLKEVPGADPKDLSTLKRSKSFHMDEATEQLSVINESDEDAESAHMYRSEPTFDSTPLFRAPSDIFAHFINLLGPSMKSLAYTLSEILRESPFGEDPKNEITVNDQLRESLKDAVALYHEARGNALHELYRSIEMGRVRSEKIQADIEEVAAACGHFSFSLQAVAEEMDSYLDVLENLKFETEHKKRSWKFLRFWERWNKASSHSDPLGLEEADREQLLPKAGVSRLRRSAIPKGIPDEMVARRDTFSWEAAPNTSIWLRKVSQVMLRTARWFTREDVLFGIKVGIGAILWAMFAFIPATRPIYETWRGEWGLLSYMIVNGMTTGAANTTGLSRFYGTLIGGICAIVAWLVGMENPFLLAFCGWLVALYNFYLIAIKNAPLGRMSLLAYNVIVLYAYSISQRVDDDDDDEGGTSPLIFDITYHRVIAVTLGIVWGILVCRILWPISARKKFREGMSVLYLQMGLIWKRGPLGVHLDSESTLDYMREGEQAALQRYAFKLESLRNSAQHEFELRGPFPHAAYGRIMRSTKHILDGFYAMRLLTQKRASLSEGERALLEFTAEDRVQLCQRICHVFQVLASCIMLEYPLTDAIPTVDRNKDRLLGRIHQFRKDHMIAQAGDEGGMSALVIAEEKDYALLYAYLLVTSQVAEELKKVRMEIERLFGVLHEESLLLE